MWPSSPFFHSISIVCCLSCLNFSWCLPKQASALLLYFSACIIVISANSYIYITFGSRFKSKWLKVYPRFTFIRLGFPRGSHLWTWCCTMLYQFRYSGVWWNGRKRICFNPFITNMAKSLPPRLATNHSYKKLATFRSNLFTYFYIYFALQTIRII